MACSDRAGDSAPEYVQPDATGFTTIVAGDTTVVEARRGERSGRATSDDGGFDGFSRSVTTYLGDRERRGRGIVHLHHCSGDGSHTIFLHYPKPT